MMDIEQLTKAQIVLLTLLVSFITSIATGIVTVSLMDQAPPGVTQVVNRVVERTVERVVPEKTQTASAGETVKEVTVVVKENDLITDAIEANAKTLVSISKRSDSKQTITPGVPVGLGFLVKGEGIVATDATLVAQRGEYVITTDTGAHFAARVISDTTKSPVALLAITRPNQEIFPSVKLANLSQVKLGQTVIALNGGERMNVAVGIVTDVERSAEADGEVVTRVRTDLLDTRVAFGSPLFNMFGEVIGIHTAKTQTPGVASYAPLPLLGTLASSEPKTP